MSATDPKSVFDVKKTSDVTPKQSSVALVRNFKAVWTGKQLS